MDKADKDFKRKPRELLARQVSMFSIGAVTLLGVIGIYAAATLGENRFERVSYIYGIIFPLIGTWMGTVMAYYFSKDNFESANKSVEKLVHRVTTADKLKVIAAKDAWIPLSSMKYLSAKADRSEDDISIGEVLEFIENNNVNRIPILTNQKSALYVIHKSSLESYIAERLMQAAIRNETIDLKKETLSEIKRKKGKLSDILQGGIGYINANDCLLDAKNIMQNNKMIQDVFATKDGTDNGEVVGWITNAIIIEKAQL